jgi:hypothetical protein
MNHISQQVLNINNLKNITPLMYNPGKKAFQSIETCFIFLTRD